MKGGETMNLRVYKNKPLHWFDDFTHPLDYFWDNIPFTTKNEKSFSPACDFHETKDYYFFSLDIPGVNKEDLHIKFHDNTLQISGEKRNEYKGKQEEGKQKFYEKFYGKFQRSFTLPTAVKEGEIETHFKNGVLELLIPKKTASKGRTISITDENKKGLFSQLLKS